jgi:hypothetical protein
MRKLTNFLLTAIAMLVFSAFVFASPPTPVAMGAEQRIEKGFKYTAHIQPARVSDNDVGEFGNGIHAIDLSANAAARHDRIQTKFFNAYTTANIFREIPFRRTTNKRSLELNRDIYRPPNLWNKAERRGKPKLVRKI